AVVVVIERGHAPGSTPIFDWELNLLHASAVRVAPECDRRRAIVGQSHIHPSILVKIQSYGCVDWWQLGEVPRLGGVPFLVPWIQKQLWFVGRKDEINRAIIIEISRNHPGRRRVTGNTECTGDISKCAVPIVAPNYVLAGFAA